MKKLLLLTALMALAFAVPAQAADTKYKSTTSVDTEDDGSMTAETKTKSTDAAGTTRVESKKVEKDGGKITRKHKKEVDGETVEDTEVENINPSAGE